MEKSKTNRILIGVKGGGCNGLKYYIEPLHSKPNKTDEIIKLEQNKELVVCGKSREQISSKSLSNSLSSIIRNKFCLIKLPINLA